ncbi:MAG: hypothetical protein ACK4RZ_07210 [Paracoccaceae bacterium]
MSAPQTNIEKQQRRHRGPLIGMAVLVVVVLLGLVWWLGQEAAGSDQPQGAGVPTDGRSGAEVSTGY